MTSPLAMNAAEREAFLREPRIGILIADRGPDRGPLATPVWYRCTEDAEIELVTSARSEKAALLARTTMATFLVQDDAPPQRFVAIEGRPELDHDVRAEVRRRIAERYLPPEAIDRFLAMTPADQLVAVRIRPERWRSSDFGKLAG